MIVFFSVFLLCSLFEDYLIALVKHLSQKKWNRGATTNITTNSTEDEDEEIENQSNNTNAATVDFTEKNNPNLLYLATALGLSGFIHVLFQWVESNPCQLLEKEIDLTAQDPIGYTPLVGFQLSLLFTNISKEVQAKKFVKISLKLKVNC